MRACARAEARCVQPGTPAASTTPPLAGGAGRGGMARENGECSSPLAMPRAAGRAGCAARRSARCCAALRCVSGHPVQKTPSVRWGVVRARASARVKCSIYCTVRTSHVPAGALTSHSARARARTSSADPDDTRHRRPKQRRAPRAGAPSANGRRARALLLLWWWCGWRLFVVVVVHGVIYCGDGGRGTRFGGPAVQDPRTARSFRRDGPGSHNPPLTQHPSHCGHVSVCLS